MSSGRPSSSTLVGKKSKKMTSSSKPNAVSLQDKLQMVENEEQVVLKHIHDLNKWTDAIDGMNEEQLKEYLENRPQELKSVKINNSNNKPKQKQKSKLQKSKPSTCSGIMASVWKFHKEDNDEDDVNKGIQHTLPSSQVK
ncbi:hypothetical protein Gotri_001114 [Gossypium trilobum]|uniref:Uncharacterized protein n=3 Tax=Gossypium TaxID=3633 RepID=A0A7J9FDJ6_9ROSI|nr:hypothetical protein [Gossypium davidsonii]MBA0668169.1 hypothetical protein [Gossypium klotzschianum]MBA0783393.1 hypothetical protein [Gossypium trilobum]